MLKNYQKRVVKDIEEFFNCMETCRNGGTQDYVSTAFGSNQKYRQYPDRPITGSGNLYPRICIKMPTGGGKTLVAVETIRAYQNIFAKSKVGLIVWITHRDQIYRQTIENLQNKSHPYRQLLDQASGNRTLIIEKGQSLRRQDVEENLVVLMLMIQSAARDTNKIFEDSGYTDFFPPENRYDLHRDMLNVIRNLDKTADTLLDQIQIKTSLGNAIRTLNPLVIVDEFHTIFTDNAVATLNSLNPSIIVGLSATPKRGMNIISTVSGRDLKAEDMIKLDMHIIPPSQNGDWRSMLVALKSKRNALERRARKLEFNKGIYIRPISLIQVERTGKDQRGHGFVHSEDVREFLITSGVPSYQIAVKSSTLDEIKAQKLLSKESEIRYIITKEALKEGWDCSFAYLLGIIPNSRNGSSMTQLVGRVLRQPYAKKTGIAELDESYVFFASGHTQEVLNHVKRGFEDEGLGDVSNGIAVRDSSGNVVSAPQVVSIKRNILKRFPESLFLPVWVIKEGKSSRRFSYDIDIRPYIKWDTVNLSGWFKELIPTIGKRRSTQVEVIVDLDGKTKTRETAVIDSSTFDTLYLTRRLTDTVENAFSAYDIANRIFSELMKSISKEALDRDAGYIASEIEKCLRIFKKTQEEFAFEMLLKSGRVELAVSDNPKLGFKMPQTDTIENNIRSSYHLTLYEDVDPSSLNTLESDVARIIEQSSNVLWWARNKVGREWYAVQGWKEGKVCPDFIIARKSKSNELEFIYVVESKGEQLLGNADTEYKDALFKRMNTMQGKIKQTHTRLTRLKFNDRFDFELIPQGEEEMRLRGKL